MIRRIFTEEEVFDLELKAHGQVQYDLGRSDERERIITLIKNKVCFDNRDNGECEHSVCYGMLDLIALLKGESK